jgi:predicted DNA-binding protein YlxM (UPF0122 family)
VKAGARRRGVLTEKMIPLIKKRYWKDFASMREIASELEVPLTTLKRFMAEHKIASRRRGAREGMAKHTVLSNEQKRALIRAIRAGKKTQSQLAHEFGVTRQWVHALKKRISKTVKSSTAANRRSG